MSRYALRSNLAALAIAVAGAMGAGAVSAAPPVDGGAPDAMHEGRHDGFHKGMHDGVYFPGLGPVSKKQLEQLKLDDKQQALVKTAQDSQRGLRDAMRAAGAKRHDLLKAQLDSGKLDPRALISQSEQNRGQFDTQMKQARDQWLAVWDSLNDAQRSQVASMLRNARRAWNNATPACRNATAGRSRAHGRACASDGSSRQLSGASGACGVAATRAPRLARPAPTLPRSGAACSGVRAGRVLGPWLLGCRLWDLVEGWGGDSRHGAGRIQHGAHSPF